MKPRDSTDNKWRAFLILVYVRSRPGTGVGVSLELEQRWGIHSTSMCYDRMLLQSNAFLGPQIYMELYHGMHLLLLLHLRDSMDMGRALPCMV